jgi:hypothetical protein
MAKSVTVKEVSTSPEVVLTKPESQEELVQIMIDREMTDGGIRVNGKLYVGKVKVTQGQADDLLRIQEEYFETKRKLMDKNVNVRMKSDFQKERLFLADPKDYEGRKNFSRDYGLLGAREWSYCTDEFKKDLLEKRMALFGY